MTTNQQELIQTFEALPAEAQRQALNFIAFLHQTYKPAITLSQKTEIDWSTKWEEWFTECESISLSLSNQHPQDEYTNLLINKYRKQGLEL